jgi:hypothetical protein
MKTITMPLDEYRTDVDNALVKGIAETKDAMYSLFHGYLYSGQNIPPHILTTGSRASFDTHHWDDWVLIAAERIKKERALKGSGGKL